MFRRAAKSRQNPRPADAEKTAGASAWSSSAQTRRGWRHRFAQRVARPGAI